MARYGLVSVDALRFQKTDFGDQHAKAEAIHRMLGHTPIPKALKKARSLSGLEAIIPAKQGAWTTRTRQLGQLLLSKQHPPWPSLVTCIYDLSRKEPLSM